MRWRRASGVLWRSAPGFLVLGDLEGNTFDVTGPGETVWRLLANELDDEELVEHLATIYGTDPAVIRSDVMALLADLEARGHVEQRA